MAQPQPDVARRAFLGPNGRTTHTSLRHAVMTCAHIHCQIAMHQSQQYYWQCLLIHASLCAMTDAHTSTRTNTLCFLMIDCEPSVARRAFLGTNGRTTHAGLPHAVFAYTRVPYAFPKHANIHRYKHAFARAREIQHTYEYTLCHRG